MRAKKIQIQVQKTASVYHLEPKQSELGIFYLHGYAENLEESIQRLSNLAPDCSILAPEGLHRFYRKGFSGEVVSSWMTSKERESEIKDYLAYLDTVWGDATFKPKPAIAIGYSQGAATLARWLAHAQTPFEEVHFCGSPLTPEINYAHLLKIYPNLFFHLGNEDPFWTEEASAKFRDQLRKRSMLHCLREFEGGHEIPISIFNAKKKE